jgi:hypothetical protein
MAPELRDRTRGGLKGIISDGVLRDVHITPLQRGWITVVSPPIAASNIGAARGQRMGPNRREKDHLRTIATHTDHNGQICEHPIGSLTRFSGHLFWAMIAQGRSLRDACTEAAGVPAPSS